VGAAKGRQQESNVKSDKVRIFVVDDQPSIASTLADILRLSGFDAIWFTNPDEALAAIKSDCPKLVISDIEMPHLSGIELAIRLKELHLDCDVLLMTGHPGYPDLLDRAEKRGHHFRVLEKPIILQKLITEIQDRNWRTS
jgi:DNA-binding NtrC family response regulator